MPNVKLVAWKMGMQQMCDSSSHMHPCFSHLQEASFLMTLLI